MTMKALKKIKEKAVSLKGRHGRKTGPSAMVSISMLTRSVASSQSTLESDRAEVEEYLNDNLISKWGSASSPLMTAAQSVRLLMKANGTTSTDASVYLDTWESAMQDVDSTLASFAAALKDVSSYIARYYPGFSKTYTMINSLREDIEHWIPLWSQIELVQVAFAGLGDTEEDEYRLDGNDMGGTPTATDKFYQYFHQNNFGNLWLFLQMIGDDDRVPQPGYGTFNIDNSFEDIIAVIASDGTSADTGSGETINYTSMLEFEVPSYKVVLKNLSVLTDNGYLRVRPVFVPPSDSDRTTLCQGVLNPTVYNPVDRAASTPYAQSSWFFRPWVDVSSYTGLKANPTKYTVGNNTYRLSVIECRDSEKLFPPGNRGCEIEGAWQYDSASTHAEEDSYVRPQFRVSQEVQTLHSPEVEFDVNGTLSNVDLSQYSLALMGDADFKAFQGDINILTSTPQFSSRGSGFTKKMQSAVFSDSVPAGCLVAGLYYNDDLVNDGSLASYTTYNNSRVAFMVYPWQSSGSLNNDAPREDETTQTAVLSQKRMSNIKFSETSWRSSESVIPSAAIPFLECFSSEDTMVKLGTSNYYGNVDTLITLPSVGKVFGKIDYTKASDGELFDTDNIYTTDTSHTITSGFTVSGLASQNKTMERSVRMRYRSTPHIAMRLTAPLTSSDFTYNALIVGELRRDRNPETDYGGQTYEALKSNQWIPAGEPISLTSSSGSTLSSVTVEWKYGDTWFQRYDCLKTYPYSQEDENMMVEIGSFMLETYTNIDGRYDRNRGQGSNLYMTPTTFNCINTVYSQLDNFFTYRLQDSDYYNNTLYPNTVFFSKQKASMADVDNWTNMSLSSSCELDGGKGKVTDLRSWNNELYCFQEKGISRVLFNSRVQIPTSDGTPVEISNNYKVDGATYLSSNIGCYNKFAIADSMEGLYFVASDGMLYLLSGELRNVNVALNMQDWFSGQDFVSEWRPTDSDGSLSQRGLRLMYDFGYKDLYISSPSETLCYSDLLGQFVSLYDYKAPYMIFNVGENLYSVAPDASGNNYQLPVVWEMFGGDYNTLFGKQYRSDFTFISNADYQSEKVFSNVEFRGDFYSGMKALNALQHDSCFDKIRVWDEYQDTQEQGLKFEKVLFSNLKKKFRVWRTIVPRASKYDSTTKAYKSSMERIRNTWCKMQFTMNDPTASSHSPYNMELHDMSVVYFT